MERPPDNQYVSSTRYEKSILLRLSNEEFQRLKWVAEALGLGVSETLRSFIPSVELPDQQMFTDDADIASAAAFDLVAVNGSCDKKELRFLLGQIREANAAITLANEIEQQLLENDGQSITVNTYKRLGRWCHPHRWTEREKRIQPLAQQLSKLILGRVVDRIA